METIDIPQISVTRTNWQNDSKILSAIRRSVFIEEQNVDEALDFDGKDPDAYHWLAMDGKKPVGTLRMEKNGKVGRMAVHQECRGQGIGAALLRHCIQFAARQGMTELYLHAQQHALKFYLQFGFAPKGDTFQEAGIQHQVMTLDLGPYRHLGDKPQSQMTPINSQEELEATVADKIEDSKRIIFMYCKSLGQDVLKSAEVIESIQQFARSYPKTRFELLTSDINPLKYQSIPLMDLQRRLSSSIEVRVIPDELQLPNEGYILLFDNSCLIKSSDISGIAAHLTTEGPAEVKAYRKQLDYLWERSTTPAELLEMRI